jgi:hypothetical protein
MSWLYIKNDAPALILYAQAAIFLIVSSSLGFGLLKPIAVNCAIAG